MAHVADDAHDRERLAPEEKDLLPDGVLPGPELLGHGLIDEPHAGSLRHIGVRDVSPLEQRHPKSPEVTRSHDTKVGRLEVPVGSRLVALGQVGEAPIASGEWQQMDGSHARHAGHRGQPILDLAVEGRNTDPLLGEFGARLRHLHGEHTIRAESRIGAVELTEAPEQ